MGLFLDQQLEESTLYFQVVHTNGRYSRLKVPFRNENSAFFVSPEPLVPM